MKRVITAESYKRLITAAFVCCAWCAAAFGEADCNAIFDSRKGEISFEIDRLDRSKSELDALREATLRVLSEKENAVKNKENSIDEKLKAIEAERAKIEAMLNANKEVLNQLKEQKDGKLTQLYSGMKASNAGEIMNALDPYLAAVILSQLDSKTAASIIARIEPAQAAVITAILHKGPPYEADANATKNGN